MQKSLCSWKVHFGLFALGRKGTPLLAIEKHDTTSRPNGPFEYVNDTQVRASSGCLSLRAKTNQEILASPQMYMLFQTLIRNNSALEQGSSSGVACDNLLHHNVDI